MGNSKSTNKSKIYEMTIIGVVAAVICILGPLSIPIGLIPISFTNLAIYISLYTLGMKKGTLSSIIYLLVGSAGLPVFSGFTSGPSKLLGPTGGYLLGFIFMTLIAGFFIDRFFNKWYMCIVGMVLATSVCYIFGTAWLAYQANISVRAALAAGVIPFIPGDLTKIIFSAYIGPKLRKRLIKANLFLP
ncbi:MAG TPA: biotin transporter BioY [Tissierellaceae bacterium]|nr:biotin transporter BioY [Tissierellaceae bacterium]